MRLPRSRAGKTPIDVGVTRQDGNPRVRLSIGDDNTGVMSYRKNSDLDFKETEDLIVLLQYHLELGRGSINVENS